MKARIFGLILGLASLAAAVGPQSNLALENKAAAGDYDAAIQISNRLPGAEPNVLRLLASKDKKVRTQTVKGKTFVLTPRLQEAFYSYAINPREDWVGRLNAMDSVAFGPKDFLDRFIKLYNSKPLHLQRIGAYSIVRYSFWKTGKQTALAAKYVKKMRTHRDQQVRGFVGKD